MPESSTTDRLVYAASRQPLSEVLPLVRSVARRLEDEELRRWVGLELSGYYADNPAADDETARPEYRAVRGKHLDAWKNPIRIQNDEVRRMVNEQRLPQGVATLERFADGDEPIFLDDSDGSRLLREHFGVTSSAFYFRPEAVHDVLDAIRQRLVDKLEERREELDRISLPTADPRPESDQEDRQGLSILRILFLYFVLPVLTTVVGAFLVWKLGFE